MTAFLDGSHLKAARVLAGLTQADLAVLAGLHPNAVKYWERASNRRPGGWAVDRIIRALAEQGVTVSLIYENGRQLASVRRG